MLSLKVNNIGQVWTGGMQTRSNDVIKGDKRAPFERTLKVFVLRF